MNKSFAFSQDVSLGHPWFVRKSSFLFVFSWHWPRLLNKFATYKTTFIQDVSNNYELSNEYEHKEDDKSPCRTKDSEVSLSLTALLYCLGFRLPWIQDLDILPSPGRESYRPWYIDRFFGCKRHSHMLLQTLRPRWLVAHL